MKLFKGMDEEAIAKKLLINATSMEESLAELLQAEAKALKKQVKEEHFSYEKINHINKVIKYILYSLTIVDDRIQSGLEFYNKSSNKQEEKK